MQYISTRGDSEPRSFKDILLAGLTPQGGLYVPQKYPQLSFDLLRRASYENLATHILRLFAPDIPFKDAAPLVRSAYQPATFGGNKKITPLHFLEPDFGLLQLSNGPTLAFKDVPMQLLVRLMIHTLRERDEELNILGATSGDTGSAAAVAIAGKERLRCFMLSPKGRMSEFQRRQMYTLNYPNIHNLVVSGTFDDCQEVVKEVNKDAEFKRQYKLGAVNSINWARIVAQVVYWVYAYLQAAERGDREVVFVVPSGNFGNALSAYIAVQMGVPATIVVATNENDVLHEFFGQSIGGQYRVRSEVHVTSSPSMDIQSASNFERYVFDITGRDPRLIRDLWGQVKEHGSFVLPDEHYEAMQHSCIRSGMANEKQVLEAIRVVNKYGVFIDPHTAVGVHVGMQHRTPGVPLIVAETAQAAKFADTIHRATGKFPPMPSWYEEMSKLPQRITEIEPDPQAVKDYIAAHVN